MTAVAAVVGSLMEALVASALLMLAVLVLRGAVRRAFGPQVAYTLWALPALRLVLPPLPAAWTPATSMGTAALPIGRAGEAVAILVLPGAVQPVAAPVAALPWQPMLLLVWVLGAALFLGVHCRRHRIFCARLRDDAIATGEIDGIRILESASAPGPLAIGVRRRSIVFPRNFALRYDADERALALAHEVGHHARRDLLANWIALVVLALHWFDPIAWRAFRAFRCDQELANDAGVLAARSHADRHVYARAIVKAAGGGTVSLACHLHTIADLKGRLRMLTMPRPSRRRAIAGSLSVLSLVGAGLFATASGTQAAAAMGERIEAVAEQLRTPPTPSAPAASPTSTAVPMPPAGTRAPRTTKRIVVVQDGRTTSYEGAAADAYAAKHALAIPPVPPVPPLPRNRRGEAAVSMSDTNGGRAVFVRRRGPDGRTMVPHVAERVCPDGPDGLSQPTILRSEQDGEQTFVICRNRIDAVARQGVTAAAEGVVAARHGLRTALASIDLARGVIRADRQLTADQRREALEGLDQAAAELRSDPDARD